MMDATLRALSPADKLALARDLQHAATIESRAIEKAARAADHEAA